MALLLINATYLGHNALFRDLFDGESNCQAFFEGFARYSFEHFDDYLTGHPI
jgi:hypothetical protein